MVKDVVAKIKTINATKILKLTAHIPVELVVA